MEREILNHIERLEPLLALAPNTEMKLLTHEEILNAVKEMLEKSIEAQRPKQIQWAQQDTISALFDVTDAGRLSA